MSKPTRRRFLRACLRGGVVGLGLPVLESMLNQSGTAYADGARLDTFFGIWFCGNGISPNAWAPKGEGTGWVLPGAAEQRRLLESLEPESGRVEAAQFYLYPAEEHALNPLLARGFQDKVSVVTGIKVPADGDGGWVQHMAGQCCALSGQMWVNNPGVALEDQSIFGGPTADQVMAEVYGVRPLVLAVEHQSS